MGCDIFPNLLLLCPLEANLALCFGGRAVTETSWLRSRHRTENYSCTMYPTISVQDVLGKGFLQCHSTLWLHAAMSYPRGILLNQAWETESDMHGCWRILFKTHIDLGWLIASWMLQWLEMGKHKSRKMAPWSAIQQTACPIPDGCETDRWHYSQNLGLAIDYILETIIFL